MGGLIALAIGQPNHAWEKVWFLASFAVSGLLAVLGASGIAAFFGAQRIRRVNRDRVAEFLRELAELEQQAITSDDELSEWTERVDLRIAAITAWLTENISAAAAVRFRHLTVATAARRVGAYNDLHSNAARRLSQYAANMRQLLDEMGVQ